LTPSAILWAFCRTNRGFKFKKRRQPFIGPRNEMLSVVAYFTLTYEPSCGFFTAESGEALVLV
jgi:hypothetical protein